MKRLPVVGLFAVALTLAGCGGDGSSSSSSDSTTTAAPSTPPPPGMSTASTGHDAGGMHDPHAAMPPMGEPMGHAGPDAHAAAGHGEAVDPNMYAPPGAHAQHAAPDAHASAGHGDEFNPDGFVPPDPHAQHAAPAGHGDGSPPPMPGTEHAQTMPPGGHGQNEFDPSQYAPPPGAADDGHAAPAGHGDAGMPMPGAGHAEGMGAVPGEMPADGGTGTGQAPQVPMTDPSYPVVQFVVKVAAGDFTGLDEFVSEHARSNVLSELRAGKATDEQKETLKEQVAQVRLLNRKSVGSDVNVYLQNVVSGDILTFVVRREDDVWLIRTLSSREGKPPRQQGQGGY